MFLLYFGMKYVVIEDMETMIIAMPVYCGEAAPCFEAAEHFNVYEIRRRTMNSLKQLECKQDSPLVRVRLLRREKVQILIVNGISNFYREMLEAEGMTVVDKVTGAVENVLDDFLNLNHIMENFRHATTENRGGKPLTEVKSWVQTLLKEKDYEIIEDKSAQTFPVDITAQTICPLCGKPVRVAVCCGSHTYSAEKEIKELYFTAGRAYDALLYVHQTTPGVKKLCSDYNIEILDPYIHFRPATSQTDQRSKIPLINHPIPGHERAFSSNGEINEYSR